MSWPTPREYALALFRAKKNLLVPGLKDCKLVCTPQGLPKPLTGGFGAVFEATTPDGKRWALKFFHKKALGTRRRYRLLAEWQHKNPMPGMVSCTWHEKALVVKGNEFPMVQMPWIEGLRLSDFLAKHHNSPDVCNVLFDCWLKLVEFLRESGIAHGDLQHNNILLVPEGHNRFQMRLVDLDGVWLPTLKDIPSSEIGHRAYQHPFRRQDPYHPGVDRFPALVIALSLAALADHGGVLWKKFHLGRNLIFRRTDFVAPLKSPLFMALRAFDSDRVRLLSKALEEACGQSPDQIPWLGDVLNGKKNQLLQNQPEPLVVEPKDAPRKTVATSLKQKLLQLADSPWIGALAGAVLTATWLILCLITGTKPEYLLTVAVLIMLVFTALPFVLIRIFQPREVPMLPFPASISPMGRWIVAGVGPDLVVWDAKNGFKGRWAAHGQQVLSTAFHPDGLMVATGGADNLVKIWHAGTSELIGELSGHGWSIVACAWSPDGTRLATASGDKTVRIWDPENLREVTRLGPVSEKMATIAFSPDGQWLAAGGNDRLWRIYKTDNWQLERSAPAHPRVVSALAFSSDSLRFASGGDDGRVQVWSISTGKRLKSFRAHDGLVTGVLFGSTDTRIFTTGSDGYLRAWDPGTGNPLMEVKVATNPLTCLEMGPRGETCLTASADGRVYRIDILKGKVLKRWTPPLNGSSSGTANGEKAPSVNG